MYLDPMTGSIVLQVVAAGFIAAMTSIRQVRRWIMNSLRSLFSRRRA
jgi:hypothetical protein